MCFTSDFPYFFKYLISNGCKVCRKKERIQWWCTELVETFDLIDNVKKIAVTNLWVFSPAKARFKVCNEKNFQRSGAYISVGIHFTENRKVPAERL